MAARTDQRGHHPSPTDSYTAVVRVASDGYDQRFTTSGPRPQPAGEIGVRADWIGVDMSNDTGPLGPLPHPRGTADAGLREVPEAGVMSDQPQPATLDEALEQLRDQLIDTTVERPLSERGDISEAIRNIARLLDGRDRRR